jgi:hypothetical protein
MREVSETTVAGDEKRRILAQNMVDCFTNQLNESNPILTDISNAMTEEGICLTHLKAAQSMGDASSIDLWQAKMSVATRKKIDGNERLMECSYRYKQMMRALREELAN